MPRLIIELDVPDSTTVEQLGDFHSNLMNQIEKESATGRVHLWSCRVMTNPPQHSIVDAWATSMRELNMYVQERTFRG